MITLKALRAIGNYLFTGKLPIKSQPELTFATFVKGVTATAVPLQIPYGSLSKLPQRDDHEELKEYFRATYSVSPKKKDDDGDKGAVPSDPDPSPDPDDTDNAEMSPSESL